MKICFTSYRPFIDGPVRQPFQESDPANIAYALEGDYFSFYTLRTLTPRQLKEKLQRYNLVFVALDAQAIELVLRIVEACEGRAATYSEGHISDYQQLSPSGQVAFLQALRTAKINFLYWEKYIPFFATLTPVPVEYLPYPYLLDIAHSYQRPISQRPLMIAVPSGLAGHTRNGLASLSVAKKLLEANVATEMIGWLEAETFDEDASAVAHFLHAAPFVHRLQSQILNWRRFLLTMRLDYRPLLRWSRRFHKSSSAVTRQSSTTIGNSTLYRRQSWSTYLSQLAPARLMIDLNNRETVGRNALDCAALGIVCISTDRSDMQVRLFPQTTLGDSWDIDGAIEICQRLLEDTSFYEHVTSYAGDAIQQFDTNQFGQRFRSIMNQHIRLV